MANPAEACDQRMGTVSPQHRGAFCIGEVRICLTSENIADVSPLDALKAFWCDSGTQDIEVAVEWCAELHDPKRRQLFDSGFTWRLYGNAENLEFDFFVASAGPAPYKRLIVDSQFRRAKLQMNANSVLSGNSALRPLTYPLDELLITHRLTQEQAMELHGCGIVGPDNMTNLFVGHSGAGKSTTAHLWTEMGGVEILSDDRIIVRYGRAAGNGSNHGIRMYGTPWHGEGQFASPASAPLQRICILEHGHGNVLTRLSPPQAVAELFARSFVPFHRHEYVESALNFLEDLVTRVPCYRYSFEPDRSAVETILNFHD